MQCERNYTIPSDNRELQLNGVQLGSSGIIPYQVITGNYNPSSSNTRLPSIIPYQVITGNYNGKLIYGISHILYHTK